MMPPTPPRAPVFVFSVLILVLASSLCFLWQDRAQILEASDQKVRQLQTNLLDSDMGFIDSNNFVLPIDRNFEEEVRGHIARKESFVDVDLKEMKLFLYQEGKLSKSLPILSKGRDGSWWETPTGKYKILSKEQNHFSSIGSVWMPWSMQFYGNFFIHGWPYHEDGSPVPTGYSGGCIRLSTEDAREVYQFVEKDMPVLVRDTEDGNSFSNLTPRGTDVPLPQVSAKAFLISNMNTGETLSQKNSSHILPIASLAKIMTGVVASELVYLGKPIAVENSMLASTFVSFDPKLGEHYIAFDLLYPLLMQSSNEAANILAGFTGQDQFVANMNKKAVSLSMNNTNFADPSGMSASDTSSASDVLKLLRYTYFKRKFILDIAKGKQDYNFPGRKLNNLSNYNDFLDSPGLVGSKNGETTAAGQTLAGVWEFETANGKVPVGIVVLGSTDRVKDTSALLSWLKQSYGL